MATKNEAVVEVVSASNHEPIDEDDYQVVDQISDRIRVTLNFIVNKLYFDDSASFFIQILRLGFDVSAATTARNRKLSELDKG